MKKIFSLNLSKEVVETIKKLAKKDSRSFSNLVELILRDYININSDKINEINWNSFVY